jgi:hypothetical protein
MTRGARASTHLICGRRKRRFDKGTSVPRSVTVRGTRNQRESGKPQPVRIGKVGVDEVEGGPTSKLDHEQKQAGEVEKSVEALEDSGRAEKPRMVKRDAIANFETRSVRASGPTQEPVERKHGTGATTCTVHSHNRTRLGSQEGRILLCRLCGGTQ